MGQDKAKLRAHWWFHKYESSGHYDRNEAYEVNGPYDNGFIKTGINELWKLATSTATAVKYNSTSARVGVGNSTVAYAATQADLQGASKARSTMAATYPTAPSSGRVDFKSSYGSTKANFAWNEFAVFNGATTAATVKMLNRLVSAQGTKTSGQTWTATCQLTIS